MARNKQQISQNRTPDSIPLKREILGFICLLIASFYYLSILSYNPSDDSIFSLNNHSDVINLGGVVGSYLAGGLFFLFGGGSYFLGSYFLLHTILFFMGKRSEIRLLDFLVFLLCAVFLSTYLQLQFGTLQFESYAINAGGTLGKILGEVGARLLGKWGIYISVVFGVILTFITATRLSFVRTLSVSLFLLAKGLLKFKPRLLQISTLIFERTKSLIFILKKKSQNTSSAPNMTTALALPAHVDLFSSARMSQAIDDDVIDVQEVTETSSPTATNETTVINIDQYLKERSEKGPKILQRKEYTPKKKKSQQLELTGFVLPSPDFLHHEEQVSQIDEASLKMSAKILEKKLKDFMIDGQVTEIHPGPIITMYEFEPAPGVKLSRISNLSDDLSLAMGGRPVRIIAPLPNKAAVGIEIPNHERETVWLKDIIESDAFSNQHSKLSFAIGKDIEGAPYVTDLKKMPHLLVAGATGSGKSVSVNTMICSILYNARPDEVRLIMIDPKMIELSIYEGIPHLLLPVVTDPKKANTALKWCVREMERRYALLADANVRGIESYNKKWESGEIQTKNPDETNPENSDATQSLLGQVNEVPLHDGPLPFIVVIIDEFADLMMVSSKEVEESVCRLAQKARACGIHVILATQRPSVDVITGIIKANFPARIAFKVTSKHDSRTIMDTVGAEHLLGQGDMLFTPPGASKMIRLHGAFVSEDEILKIVSYLKEQAEPIYNEEILASTESEEGSVAINPEDLDEFYDQAVREVARTKRVSISGIQRRFRIGYNRAARIVEQMQEEGVVSAPNAKGHREVLVQDFGDAI